MRFVIDDPDRVGRWVADRVQLEWHPDRAQALGVEKGGRLIGGVVIEDYTGTSCVMHVAGEGQWLTRRFLRFVFGYVFLQLRCRVVIGFVVSSNERALAFDRKLGFTEKCRIEGAHPDGDVVIVTMRKEQCRWINE